MTLHFGYIEGISRIDTPYFANIAEQENYFDSHEVVTIESSFYPPHYLNEIKVDTDDVDFTDKEQWPKLAEFQSNYAKLLADNVFYPREEAIKQIIKS